MIPLALVHGGAAAVGADGGALPDLFTLHSLAALATLTLLEVVLGIDNIVFLAILTAKLDPAKQKFARRIGLILAMVARVVLLLGIGLVMRLTEPWIHFAGFELSGKDLILLGGGGFLLTKAVIEIYHSVEGEHDASVKKRAYAAMGTVIVQIVIMDLIFSLDSVITAVGMSRQIPIMVTAIVIAIGIMMVFAEPISSFVEKHPSVKILALAFLVLIGVLLVAEGLGEHINKGYIYSALAFSVGVEALQIRAGKKRAANP
jgi:predicted tellurium resistance membrane protein TerC